jgi:hypothetical protein
MKAGKDMFAMTRSRVPRTKLSPPAHLPVLSRSSRTALLDSAHAAALADPAFRDLTAQADSLRDTQQWQAAAQAYGRALRLYPYERSYWTQLGHMLKEQALFGPAEIAYRTSAAFGCEPQDVRPHLRFVMERQGVSEQQFPIRFFQTSPSFRQIPGRPDMLAFGRLLWGVQDIDDIEQLGLLRNCASLDELVAAMIRDPRFEKSNRQWLELVREDEL